MKDQDDAMNLGRSVQVDLRYLVWHGDEQADKSAYADAALFPDPLQIAMPSYARPSVQSDTSHLLRCSVAVLTVPLRSL